MHDAHFHFSNDLIQQLKKNQMDGICNVENIEEYKRVKEEINPIHYSCGIHPWHADEISFIEMEPLLKNARFIGEIGLDNTWCTTDLTIQKQVFEQQLHFAYTHNKPVILHLKGMEKEALEFLKMYPNTYIVHWYSDFNYVDEYNEIASFFTVGPSIGLDDSVNHLVKTIDISKLLLESDGLDAIEWAFNEKVDYIKALRRSILEISKIKNMDVQEVEDQLDSNFNRLMNQ